VSTYKGLYSCCFMSRQAPFEGFGLRSCTRSFTSSLPSPILMVTTSKAEKEEAGRLVEAHSGRLPTSCIDVRDQRAKHGAVFRSGTLLRIKEALAVLEGNKKGSPAKLFVNKSLKPLQERNLSRAIGGREVIDRTRLVIEIFSLRAQTREARLQTELASLVYAQSRLVRPPALRRQRMDSDASSLPGLQTIETEVVSGRQRGGSGGSAGGGGGQGEQELADQRYRIKKKIYQLRQSLKDVRHTRDEQRKSRVMAGLPSVALVGYTNAGKSSLLSLLANDEKIVAKDALFVTLDPLSRRVILPSNQVVIATDTVGFIQSLPVSLIDAFMATLEEVKEADLIVHVIDSTHPSHQQQRKTVINVLTELGVSPYKLHNSIEVWNKCDRLMENLAVDRDRVELSSLEPMPSALDLQQQEVEDARARGTGTTIQWSLKPSSLSWPRFASLYGLPAINKRQRRLKMANETAPIPSPDQTWFDGKVEEEVPIKILDLSSKQDAPLKPSRPLFSHSEQNFTQRKLHTMKNDGDSANDDVVMSEILLGVREKVVKAQDRCQYKPLSVACSAKMGWGVDTLLLAIENKLKGLGKLRGS
jgi:50S ribosomal subunit-associated GTPase HflX